MGEFYAARAEASAELPALTGTAAEHWATPVTVAARPTRPTAIRSTEEAGIALATVGEFGRPLRCGDIEQAPDQGERGWCELARKSKWRIRAETVRQDMQQKAPNELAGR